MGVFVSLNLIMFYIFWELTLIPMFFLIGVWGGERRSYAALKFILFTFTGSAIMLLGFLSLYLGVPAQTFDIPDLAGKVPAGLQYLPLLATFVGFAVELPAFPFHGWQPDAYEQAPAPVNVLLAGVLPKFAGFGLIRISVDLFPQAAHQYAWAFILVGIVSMFYGAIVAVLAKDLKRMFAYTSINHMGFILFGVFATVASGNLLGVEGAILLMFVHALAVGSLFHVTGYIQKLSGTREISGLRGIRQRMPMASTLLVFSSCAAMALPPFATFLAELMIISAGISANSFTAITILVPVITGGYFLWMLKRTVLTPPEQPVQVNDISGFDVAVLAVYLIPMILIIVFSFLIISPAEPVAKFVVQLGGQH
jgi:NADH-quinone oxidoreductase subunit M